MKKLTSQEELLVELVFFMSKGSKLSVKDLKTLLQTPMSHKKNKNCLECLEKDGRAFLNEIITFINEVEGDR